MSAPTSASSTVGHAVIDARDGIQALDLSRERACVLLDFAIQIGDQFLLVGQFLP